MKYFSMFSGIGGFELGIQRAYELQSKNERLQVETNSGGNNGELLQRTASCVGYSEIDKYAIKVYERNFNESCDEHAHISQESEQKERKQGRKRSTDKQGLQLHDRNRSAPLCNRCKGHKNYGDATKINPEELPDFDLLVGGFPCQAFSIAGKRKGFDDTRGTLFFDIARILSEKKPKHLVLENVKGLLTHEQGRTFQTIIGVLADLGYGVEWQVLNSKDFGVPQNRERVIIVGHLGAECSGQVFPITNGNRQDTQSTERQSDRPFQLLEVRTEEGKRSRREIRQAEGRDSTKRGKDDKKFVPKSDGLANCITTGQANIEKWVVEMPRIRRLTPLECERLQGFPDDWTKYGEDEHGMRVDISDTQRYKMCGNAVTVNVVEAVITNLIECLN